MVDNLPDSFAEFGKQVLDSTRSVFERTGFPDRFRRGYTNSIFKDICTKLTGLGARRARVLDVGCGASPLTERILRHAKKLGQRVDLIDHENVLKLVRTPKSRKFPGAFPADHATFIAAHLNAYDAILVYSVIQYVHRAGDLDAFVDAALKLLAPGGRLLLGDVPNASMRDRFLDSPGAAAYHAAHFGPAPMVRPAREGQLADDDVFRILRRARDSGFNAFVVPQNPNLPFANRREDILIERLT